MSQLQGVLWRKGVALTPQHLQAQDRFFEGLLSFQLTASTPYPWGFLNLEIDLNLVDTGVLALTTASGIMRDGLMFSIPGSDPGPPPLSFSEDWPQDALSQVIYLGLPEHRDSGKNVGAAEENLGFRFVAEDLDRRDELTGKSERPIQIARKNFRLLSESANLEGHTVVPVARVLKDGSTFAIDPTFIPPSLSLASSPYLRSILRQLVEVMTAKGAELADQRGERQRGVAHFGASEIGSFWLLHTVNTYLPEGRHLLGREKSHPLAVFNWMTSLAGALTTFSRDVDPTDLPSYDHQDLGGCLGRLNETIRELLGTVLPTLHASVPLIRSKRSIYSAELDRERYLRGQQYYLAIAADVESVELADRVPQLVKVSSLDRLDQVTEHGLPGLTLTHMAAPPSALPVRLDYLYFRLETSGEHWQAIRTSRRLAAFVPDEFANPRIELVMLLSEKDIGG